ncbi:MAG: helix-turn-helix transcriptional regulator [Planctomycetes bacterium]|nr:helix-turn-helix transcriptional regulator [Candidatus Omnitrophota bacterium]MBI5308556.1 helix-turn-helix transcriptional regulator [Planctomycetota bacterium]
MAGLSKEFGRVVRRRRYKLNLSQENLAELADIHRTYVSSIESGKVSISIEVARKVAKSLKVPLGKLISEAERNL